MRRAALALAAVLPLVAGRAAAQGIVVDAFDDTAGWSAVASEGARVWTISESGPNGPVMRVGFDLGMGGHVIVRKKVSIALPKNYAFTFALKGEGRPNNFEFKLIDPTGKNVWWRSYRDFTFPPDWQPMTIRRSRISFAWGPSAKELTQTSAIEIAISAGEGGAGSVWLDDLRFEAREPAIGPEVPPTVQASSTLEGTTPAALVDADATSRWRSEPIPREQWVVLDFGRNREYGGLVLDWDAEDYARAFDVSASNDGHQWTQLYSTTTGHGGRAYVYLPDGESRYLRIDLKRSSRGQGYGMAEVTVKPVAFSASPNDFFAAIAREAPRGAYPKYLDGRQTYWTLVGVPGDEREALLNEEGMLEVDRGAFSLEPFLHTGDALVTWADVKLEQQLAEGYLPIPSVVWRRDGLTMTITAFADGDPGASTVFVRYRLENTADRGQPVRLYVALRPFQVTPPWQSLTMNGGVARIHDVRFDGRAAWVNRDRAVVSLTPPDDFGATTFEEGAITEFLLGDRLPPAEEVNDHAAFASAALRYNLYLEPRKPAEVTVAVPMHDPPRAIAALLDRDATPVPERLRAVRARWETALDRVELRPPTALGQRIADVLRTNIAYILVNRDGPALQPGARNYARSWIRDGALTSAALLEMGFTREVRDFIEWYARYQGPDGKIPCCVDRRGADPVSEHDSAGEFIWAIADYYRHTRDVGFVHQLWPQVVRAVDYLVALRSRRLGEEYQTPERRAYYGLLPESISHEGYSAHPVHSYWDDFFALRGFRDAAELAGVVGDDERRGRFASLRDAFRETLYASIERTMAMHRIDYLPASVELGDFDPTSTAVAIAPGGELEHLPAEALRRTYARYWEQFEARRAGTSDGVQYSGYELRNAEALVRMGEREKALALVEFFFEALRPPAWNAWGEITWRDPEAPHFIGDMPHGWVGSTFVRAVRSMVAYERDGDRALVLLAGTPPEWATTEPGLVVRRLPTHYGPINLTLRAEGPATVRLRLTGDLDLPPGGVVVHSPLARPFRSVAVNGRPLDGAGAGPTLAVVREFPADVVFQY